MGWRFWAAGLVLGIGFILWTRHQLDETRKWAPSPNHWSFPTHHDARIRRLAAEHGFPRSGVIGYRDDKFEPDPPEAAREGMHSAFRGIFQYALAPVILDDAAPHEPTLVLTKTGSFYLERRRAAGGR